jgi:hypothetical protein
MLSDAPTGGEIEEALLFQTLESLRRALTRTLFCVLVMGMGFESVRLKI